jgi:hypothetical protein
MVPKMTCVSTCIMHLNIHMKREDRVATSDRIVDYAFETYV